MKKQFALIATGLVLIAGIAYAHQVHDWKDLKEVHKHVVESIREMERARTANHYDMAGHGARAEELLRQAEHELHDAIEAAKQNQ